MEISEKEYLWVEKYRPQKIADCILPPRLKEYFQAQTEGGELQNMLLVGGPGTGKTTVAKAMCKEMGIDVMVVNASENGDINTLRSTIRSFASTVSFMGGTKCVILDEADYLTHVTQPALRAFIEEFSKNCRFILTANFKNKIIDPLKSRLAVIEFQFTKEEKRALIVDFDRRVRDILEAEGIDFDKKVMAQVIIKYFPDFRKTINEMQRHSQTGSLAAGSVAGLGEDSIKELVTFLAGKQFGPVRKWVVDNLDSDFAVVQRALYDRMYDYVEPHSIPQLVMTLASYDYKHAFVIDKEINLVAMFVEIMAEIKFR